MIKKKAKKRKTTGKKPKSSKGSMTKKREDQAPRAEASQEGEMKEQILKISRQLVFLERKIDSVLESVQRNFSKGGGHRNPQKPFNSGGFNKKRSFQPSHHSPRHDNQNRYGSGRSWKR